MLSHVWTGADLYVALAIIRGAIIIDPDIGAVYRGDGRTRAEVLARHGAGKVQVAAAPRVVYAPAHRVVWIRVNGPIPVRHVVRHRNNRLWDNRPDNLYLSRARGFVTYPAEASAHGPAPLPQRQP